VGGRLLAQEEDDHGAQEYQPYKGEDKQLPEGAETRHELFDEGTENHEQYGGPDETGCDLAEAEHQSEAAERNQQHESFIGKEGPKEQFHVDRRIADCMPRARLTRGKYEASEMPLKGGKQEAAWLLAAITHSLSWGRGSRAVDLEESRRG